MQQAFLKKLPTIPTLPYGPTLVLHYVVFSLLIYLSVNK